MIDTPDQMLGTQQRLLGRLRPVRDGADAAQSVRLREPDVERLLDTESFGTAAIRLCRSLGLDIENDLDIPLDDADEDPPDSS